MYKVHMKRNGGGGEETWAHKICMWLSRAFFLVHSPGFTFSSHFGGGDGGRGDHVACLKSAELKKAYRHHDHHHFHHVSFAKWKMSASLARGIHSFSGSYCNRVKWLKSTLKTDRIKSCFSDLLGFFTCTVAIPNQIDMTCLWHNSSTQNQHLFHLITQSFSYSRLTIAPYHHLYRIVVFILFFSYFYWQTTKEMIIHTASPPENLFLDSVDHVT